MVPFILVVGPAAFSSYTSALATETPAQQTHSTLPSLTLPDPKIAEVYRGNWINTLLPCRTNPVPAASAPDIHSEPLRPWKVDVGGHYPGWYPGVDVKHSAAAYLACEGNLPLVLQAWELTARRYQMLDGGVRPMTMHHNPHNMVPEKTQDSSVVYYPLRLTATIDFILLGDLIYRFSQDRAWLQKNLAALRLAREFIEGWIDTEGLLYSHSYDLDQVYREIDGVAQASAYLALSRLAGLERVGGDSRNRNAALRTADRLRLGAEKWLWDESQGYYSEHLVYRNAAADKAGDNVLSVGSTLNTDFEPSRAIDGIMGIGVDAFGVGKGAAGKHEWASRREGRGAFIQVRLGQETSIDRVILINRTTPGLAPCDRFAEGVLEFSDGSPSVPIRFNRLDISKAEVKFRPRTVHWITFRATAVQGPGEGNPGLAEFMAIPADLPYHRITHGMTDTNFAMVGFGLASEVRSRKVWDYFKQHESAFYQVGNLFAPTWIAEKAADYGKADLNLRAPHKDCVAMARTWRYDVLMRRRMGDGEGIHRTISYANKLYDRPSGGGVGLWAERYGIGRFQPGDESMFNVPAYAEYPAVYNSTVVQEALLGVTVTADGVIEVAPCVPKEWWAKGFGADGMHIQDGLELGFQYTSTGVKGWISGKPGWRRLRITLAPGRHSAALVEPRSSSKFVVQRGVISLSVQVESGKRSEFEVRGK